MQYLKSIYRTKESQQQMH